MSARTPIRFGVGNHVRDADLSTSTTPDTDIDWMKNEHRARLVLWQGQTSSVLIRGTLPETRVADFVALVNPSLGAEDYFDLTLHENDDYTGDFYTTGNTAIGSPTPWGVGRFGIDPFAAPVGLDKPDVVVEWFAEPFNFQSFTLFLSSDDYGTGLDISLRTLVIGEAVQMESGMSYPHGMRRLTSPELVRLTGGSFGRNRQQKRSRAFSLELPQCTDVERILLERMEDRLLGDPFIVSGYPDATGWRYANFSYYALLADALDFSETYEGNHVTSMTLLEV